MDRFEDSPKFNIFFLRSCLLLKSKRVSYLQPDFLRQVVTTHATATSAAILTCLQFYCSLPNVSMVMKTDWSIQELVNQKLCVMNDEYIVIMSHELSFFLLLVTCSVACKKPS